MNDEQNDFNQSNNQIDRSFNDLTISNETLTNGYEYAKIEKQNASSKQRKLILHFDNRNTLQVANNVSATTIEQGVNNFLTGVLWGYEEDDGQWKWISEKPSLQKPADCSHCITYFKYLEGKKVKEASDRGILRKLTGDFINNEGACFRHFYDDLIESLRYYPSGSTDRADEDRILKNESIPSDNSQRPRRLSTLHTQEVPVNGFRSVSGTLYHYILPAFFRLIKYLQETNRDFVIYLRTMGDDSANFLANARRVVLLNEHPSFKFDQLLDVDTTPGRIERSNNRICLKMKFPDDNEIENLDDEFQIHEKLENGQGIHAIKDDFNAWCSTNYHYTTSKPIWFDPDDPHPRSHHILFDDNFRVIDPYDSIVDIRIMNRDKNQCYSCPFEFYPKLENIFAVQADLYRILADKDYYVNAVQQCEQNLDKLLQDRQTLQEIKEKSILPN